MNINLIKDLGISRTLTTLMESEALLNDGCAIVIFEIALDIAEGLGNAGFWKIIGNFCRLVFGGIAMGLVFSFIATYWLHKLFRKPEIEN